MIYSLVKDENESLDEYIQRLVENKDLYELKWYEIADLINKYSEKKLSPDAYRKRVKVHKSEGITKKEDEESHLEELQKLKVKISDERIQNRAYIRKIAREETYKEIAEDTVDALARIKPFQSPNKILNTNSQKDGIIILSDWHYGIEVENVVNTYNPTIFEKRLQTVLNETYKYAVENSLTHINVVDLGDLISGLIHTTIRLSNRIDVISQIMAVSEYLASFLFELSKYFSVDYYGCIDNHSRLSPNKEESLSMESLTRITPWFLMQRLKDNPNVTINRNTVGSDIITFSSCGHNIAGVHGDKDTPEKIIENLTLFTKTNYELILMAHKHHFRVDEKNGVLVMTNGSLMGTDDYAYNKRLSSNPSQTFIVVTPNNVAEMIHRIIL